MHLIQRLLAAVLLSGGLAASPGHAAESYDNCTGFIDSLPATISTQGTWCLRKDLSTAMADGYAIQIQTNNVTINCNDFKVGGLAAGMGANTIGIFAADKLNITVRRCNVRGFMFGVGLLGETGGGHVVEDNRFDSNTHTGALVEGDGSQVRRNLVRDTGGSTVLPGAATGIQTDGDVDVLDNTISGLLPSANNSGDAYPAGIDTRNNDSGSISGNRVRGLVSLGNGFVTGIVNRSGSAAVTLRSNDLVGPGGNGSGISCDNAQGIARDNVVLGFTTGIATCSDSGGNVVTP